MTKTDDGKGEGARRAEFMRNRAFTVMLDQGLRKITLLRLCRILSLLAIAHPIRAQLASVRVDPFTLVDPRIGTAHEGQTYPVVGVPFGMTGWTPETRSTEGKCIAPYYFKDTRITGFRGSHWLSGSCTQDYGTVTVMPTVGALKVTAEERSSGFAHGSESMSPAFYSVLLRDYSTKVEATGTSRAGMLRITFPEAGDRHLVIQPNARSHQGFVEVRPQSREIVGYNPVVRIYQGAGQSAGFSGFNAIRMREEITDSGTWCDAKISHVNQLQGKECEHLGAYVTLGKGTSRQVIVRIGTSFTSIQEAEQNLEAEEPNWNFDAVRAQTEMAWKKHLGQIEVQGGSEAQRKVFYTALFHASLAPRAVSDADGTYWGFGQERKLHHAPKGTAYFDDFSLWDTFRALHPLLTILNPQLDGQMMQSLVDKGEQGGFLPIFPTWNSYTSEMIGDHAVAVFYDAYAKGIRNFDYSKAYQLVRQNAFVTPPREQYVEGKGRRALTSYTKYGYIPLEDEVLDAFHHREQVSRTLEYAFDDYVAAQFARSMGHADDAALLEKRSTNWKNVLDPETRFVRGRYANGTWITPFDPATNASYITEGLPWQYTFFVPHDVNGLIGLLGGEAEFVAKLDGLFDRNLYDQGNEPSHGIAYLYNSAGAPEKTQERVRHIMGADFGTGNDGLPGNDDAGQMSAWYVFSAMGFYPACPGTTAYSIGSPIFSRVVIHLPNRKRFTIRAAGNADRNIYVRNVLVNGEPRTNWILDHKEILAGSTVKLQMSADRNH